MAELEQGLEELKVVKQAFKENISANNVSTSNVEFRNMPELIKQMEKKLPTQTKTVTPTTSEQDVSADTGYKLTGVKVEAVTKDIDANIKAENIKDGVTILGETGTLKSDLVDVDELPTTDIDDSKIYRVNLVTGAYYMMYFGTLIPLTDYFQYREISVSSIDDVTEPEITTGVEDVVIYTDTSTYIGYVFTDAETPTSLGVFFGEGDDFNKGYVEDTSTITEGGIYYTQSITRKIGVPNKNNEEILEYWLNEKWTRYLRLTRDMVVGVWKYDNGDYVEYLELNADGSVFLKDKDGVVEKEGTFSIGSGSYFVNIIGISYAGEDGSEQLHYVVTEDAVKLGFYVNNGEEYYVKQSEYVVAEVSSGDKFGELVNGTLTTIESGDLADVTYIREGAFENIVTLTSANIPSNVVTIGANAFNGCTGLNTLTLSEGLVTIGANAFNGVNASEINIPSTVTTIGEGAFANNTAISSVTIPSGVTVLSANMFGGCTSLAEVTMEATTPPSVTDTTFPSNVTAIKVPYSSYDSYVASWTTYADKIVRLPAIPSTITVTVDNYLGELVSGASVTIEGNGQTYTGTTNESGVFVQGDLQPATYTVSVADMEGFQTPNVSEVVVVEDSQNAVTITYLEKSAFSTTFSENTPDVISAIADEISANSMTSAQVEETYGWKIGDTKDITLTTGEVIQMRIIGFNHDTLSGGTGTAGITLQMVDCLATKYPMNSTARNAGGYAASVMKTSTLPTVKALLPQEWQDVIKLVDKKSANGGSTNYSKTLTLSEDIFLLAEIEVFGTTTYAQDGANEGSVYEYWNGKDATGRIKKCDTNADGVADTVAAWWLRSSGYNDTGYFCYVNASGNAYGYLASASRGVSFAFCVGGGATGGDTPSFSTTFGENTPEQISAVSEQISANNMTSAEVEATYGWKLGDTISYTLSTGENVEMRIIGFNHDDKSDGSGKAGITLEMTNCLATKYKMNSSRTSGGFPVFTLNTETFPTIKSQMPTEWQNAIKMVDKKSGNGGGLYYSGIVTSSEDLFVLSYIELMGSGTSIQEGSGYEYWVGKVATDRKKTANGTATGWWLRTCGNTTKVMFSVQSNSGAINEAHETTELLGVSYAFCI